MNEFMCSRLISHTYVSLVLFETMTIAIKSLPTSLNIIFMEVLEIYILVAVIYAPWQNHIIFVRLIKGMKFCACATMLIVIKSGPLSLDI